VKKYIFFRWDARGVSITNLFAEHAHRNVIVHTRDLNITAANVRALYSASTKEISFDAKNVAVVKFVNMTEGNKIAKTAMVPRYVHTEN
jgi:hypothetical protein